MENNTYSHANSYCATDKIPGPFKKSERLVPCLPQINLWMRLLMTIQKYLKFKHCSNKNLVTTELTHDTKLYK
jgi:hypothetical protein